MKRTVESGHDSSQGTETSVNRRAQRLGAIQDESRRIGLTCLLWLGAEDFDEEEAGADDDAAVGYVEVGPVVVDDVDFEEVDDVVVADAVVEVAEGSAEDEGEGDGGEGEVRPTRQSMPRRMMTATTEKAMRMLRTVTGEAFSANMLKAAPVLWTSEMRKTPGMTVWAWPLGRLLDDDVLGDAVDEDDEGGDGEDEAALVARLAVELGLGSNSVGGYSYVADIRLAAPWCAGCRAGS